MMSFQKLYISFCKLHSMHFLTIIFLNLEVVLPSIRSISQCLYLIHLYVKIINNLLSLLLIILMSTSITYMYLLLSSDFYTHLYAILPILLPLLSDSQYKHIQ